MRGQAQASQGDRREPAAKAQGRGAQGRGPAPPPAAAGGAGRPGGGGAGAPERRAARGPGRRSGPPGGSADGPGPAQPRGAPGRGQRPRQGPRAPGRQGRREGAACAPHTDEARRRPAEPSTGRGGGGDSPPNRDGGAPEPLTGPRRGPRSAGARRHGRRVVRGRSRGHPWPGVGRLWRGDHERAPRSDRAPGEEHRRGEGSGLRHSPPPGCSLIIDHAADGAVQYLGQRNRPLTCCQEPVILAVEPRVAAHGPIHAR